MPGIYGKKRGLLLRMYRLLVIVLMVILVIAGFSGYLDAKYDRMGCRVLTPSGEIITFNESWNEYNKSLDKGHMSLKG